MFKIQHRVNTIEELQNTSTELGVEVDIRSNNQNLIIHHDPFQEGVLFHDWLKFFKHKFLILNVKEEGLEDYLLNKMKEKKIDNFFFLDQSFPFLIKTSNNGESRCAVRFSEYESVETVISLSGKIDWVWIDCFNKFPLNNKIFDLLKEKGFKLCFVSPELQGRSNIDGIKEYIQEIKNSKMYVDAVCTKYPELWE